jgi:hypothetical protein
LPRTGVTATLLRASEFPLEHHDRIFGVDCPNGNVRRAEHRRASPTRVLLREYTFDCEAALVSVAAHRDPVRVVGVQPAKRANVVGVSSIDECIGKRARS